MGDTSHMLTRDGQPIAYNSGPITLQRLARAAAKNWAGEVTESGSLDDDTWTVVVSGSESSGDADITYKVVPKPAGWVAPEPAAEAAEELTEEEVDALVNEPVNESPVNESAAS